MRLYPSNPNPNQLPLTLTLTPALLLLCQVGIETSWRAAAPILRFRFPNPKNGVGSLE